MTEDQYRDLNKIALTTISYDATTKTLKDSLAKYLRASESIQANLRTHEVDTDYLAWYLTLAVLRNYAIHYGPL